MTVLSKLLLPPEGIFMPLPIIMVLKILTTAIYRLCQEHFFKEFDEKILPIINVIKKVRQERRGHE